MLFQGVAFLIYLLKEQRRNEAADRARQCARESRARTMRFLHSDLPSPTEMTEATQEGIEGADVQNINWDGFIIQTLVRGIFSLSGPSQHTLINL
jgi:hypothetical protein